MSMGFKMLNYRLWLTKFHSTTKYQNKTFQKKTSTSNNQNKSETENQVQCCNSFRRMFLKNLPNNFCYLIPQNKKSKNYNSVS